MRTQNQESMVATAPQLELSASPYNPEMNGIENQAEAEGGEGVNVTIGEQHYE